MSVSERFRGANLPGRLAVALTLISMAPLLGGCDWLRGTKEPEMVRLEIGGDAQSVTLVMSMLFTQVPDSECPACEPVIQLIEADTMTVSTPFDQTFSFTQRLQVFFSLYPTEETPATLSMRVNIDDANWADESRMLQPFGPDGKREVMRFVYQYRDISF